MKILRMLSVCFIVVLTSPQVFAQPVEQMVKVIVAPDHPDWLYKVGENVKFTISVLRFGNPVKAS